MPNIQPTEIDADVQHVREPGEIARHNPIWDDVLSRYIVSAVMRGDTGEARDLAREVALWRDSQLTSAERTAKYEPMRVAA